MGARRQTCLIKQVPSPSCKKSTNRGFRLAGTFLPIGSFMARGRGACQSDVTGKVNTGIFPISFCGQRNGSRASHPSARVLNHFYERCCDPPSQQPVNPDRKVHLYQTVDYAVQLLVEEAHLVGWQRVKFLTAIMDAANSRLAAIEDQRKLDDEVARTSRSNLSLPR